MEAQSQGGEGAGKFSGETLAMRQTLIITTVIQCLSALWVQAGTLPFEQGYAEPLYAPKIEIVWGATNTLPGSVKVFKVIPANFSTTAISNLTALGGTSDSKHGRMNLYKPINSRLPLKNVPDKARAYKLGTNLLTKLEIPAAELSLENGCPKAGFYPGTRGHMDMATRKMITEPCTMGVRFKRILDGLECYGQQVHVQYESQETITQLVVEWHGVQAEKAYAVAKPEQIIAWIREGRARAHPIETTGSRWIKVADIKKAIVRDIRLCYNADPSGESPEKTPSILYPYALIKLEIEFSPNDRESFGISCPIIKEALSRAVRKTGEFNILPKSFYEKQAQQEGGA